ncbi:hypothetical protein, partial [uncultured Intestinimonas sp.]|uniref:hypothetical protein n=1 Tax=uncultured Intestinimonas sp. TaxID=1689265 RepID=UPI00294347B3
TEVRSPSFVRFIYRSSPLFLLSFAEVLLDGTLPMPTQGMRHQIATHGCYLVQRYCCMIITS